MFWVNSALLPAESEAVQVRLIEHPSLTSRYVSKGASGLSSTAWTRPTVSGLVSLQMAVILCAPYMI